MSRVATSLTPQARPAREVIPCAFCNGKGVDPFAIMSELSVCGCCHGRGTVRVLSPHVRCTFCRGTGSHKTYRCPVCGGAGAIAAFPVPSHPCPDCEGRAFEAFSGRPCLGCRGRGVVADRTRSPDR
jgi:DnaJ-class molecular chaperone